jgi:lipoate-protein ligase A
MRYEIKVGGRKLLGSAQRRFGNSFIQHGSIPVKGETLGLVELLPVTCPEKKKKVEMSLKKWSISLEGLLEKNPKVEEMISAVKSGFGSFFSVNLVNDKITYEELELAGRLICKYRSQNWNSRR